MNKLRLVLAAASLAALATSTAIAGARWTWGYTLDPVARYASGVFSDVRDTPDPYSRASCGSNADFGYCEFVNSANNYYYCYTINPKHTATILSMSGDSFFSVTWNAAGECTGVFSHTMSSTNPKSR